MVKLWAETGRPNTSLSAHIWRHTVGYYFMLLTLLCWWR